MSEFSMLVNTIKEGGPFVVLLLVALLFWKGEIISKKVLDLLFAQYEKATEVYSETIRSALASYEKTMDTYSKTTELVLVELSTRVISSVEKQLQEWKSEETKEVLSALHDHDRRTEDIEEKLEQLSGFIEKRK